MRRLARLAAHLVVPALVPLLGACGAGSATSTGSAGAASADDADALRTATPRATPTGRPSVVPVVEGELTTTYPVTVLDDGGGAELCLGGVLTSLPPQCGGPALVGWDWSEHVGEFEERSGVRWGEFVVTGTFDGESFTPTSVVPIADAEAPPRPDDHRDLTTPCPEPEGGRPAGSGAARGGSVALMAAAEGLPRYSHSWVDSSSSPVVVTVRLAEDDPAALAEAEAALRRAWDGRLCVVGGARHTRRELQRVQDEVLALPGILGAGQSEDRMEVEVVADDGTLQAWADATYGAGTVLVSSALVPAD